MSLKILAIAILDTLLSKSINNNPELIVRLLPLKGKVIQIHAKEFNSTLTFLFNQKIDILGNYEGESDCYLALDFSALIQLLKQTDAINLIKQDKILYRGNIQLAQKFFQLVIDCKLHDVEEWLSYAAGDVVSHTIVQNLKSLIFFIQKRMAKNQNYLSQFFSEEQNFFPAPLEISYFFDQIDHIKNKATHLEMRLSKLLENT
ncbi:hypothetical protein CF67_17053 [Candidatus Photodesmus blepharus]|uniref:Ubiquinone biosynthesis accessory factor UbiJ n=1 Tax=Candidatus Photodesmus blepharonis TaxID=1179155 RepID=A0A084CNR9_9GAMM|nr:SCP2 sterol-binding domain-containing protein [Candidatus Photodesmus blepharus]KEY91448.1 hypothetical protein CF67_17053 [Candidatus Photodesmus blepharus]